MAPRSKSPARRLYLALISRAASWALSVVCISSLTSAFLIAPFGHIHDSGQAAGHVAAEHGGSVALHLHLAASSPESPLWNEADHSAQSLNAFVLEKFDEINLQPAPAGGFLLEPPPEASDLRVVAPSEGIPENPGIRTSRPRGPPAFLS